MPAAVTTGHEALDSAAGISSLRPQDRLRDLHHTLGTVHQSIEVRDLHDRLTAA